jgi:anti-sigma B factor antagonist
MRSEQLTVKVSSGTLKGERIIKVDGPLTMTSLLDFEKVIRAEKAPTVILDLSDVPYIDSTGLGSVVNVHISCLKSGRHFAVVGISDRVYTLFKVARLQCVLAIFPTLQDAEKGYCGPVDI